MGQLKKYIPALNHGIKVEGDDVLFITKEGNGVATAVAAGATVEVTITHSAFNLNTVPEVATTTANATVAVDKIKAGSFVIKVTNGGTASADVSYSYKRVGL